MIRVMIADDHQLFAEGLSEGLTAIPDLRVVGVVSNGSELLERLKSQPADVLLIDLEMPGLDGMGTSRRSPPQPSDCRFHARHEQTRQRGQGRSSGYVLKGVPLLDIAAAIRAVADGEALVAGVPVSERYRQPTLDPGAAALTDRETEILSLLAKGVSSPEDWPIGSSSPEDGQNHWLRFSAAICRRPYPGRDRGDSTGIAKPK